MTDNIIRIDKVTKQFPGGVKGTEAGYLALLDHLVSATAKALNKSP